MATITKPMALDESFNTTESTSRNQADVLAGIEQAIVRGFGQVANAVSYDNTDSGLTADNVQDAIDEVDDTVDGLVDDVAEISSDIESTQTASGNPLTLTECAPINVEKLEVEFEPKQDLHGQDAPYVGGAGKNKLPMTVDGIKAMNTIGTWSGNTYSVVNMTFEIIEDNDGNVIGIKINGTSSSSTAFDLVNMSFSVGEYVLTDDGEVRNDIFTFVTEKGGTNNTSRENPFSITASESRNVGIYISGSGVSATNVILKPMIRLSTETDPTFAPYSNICPITGYDEVNVDDVGKNLLNIDAVSYPYTDSNSNVQVSKNTDGSIKLNGTATGEFLYPKYPPNQDFYKDLKPSTNYIASVGSDNTDITIQFYYLETPSSEWTLAGEAQGSLSFTTPNDYYVIWIRYMAANGTSFSNLTIYPMVRLATDADSNFEPYQSSNATIQFGQTVYGGKVDFLTGELTVDRAMVDLGDLAWDVSPTSGGNNRFYAPLNQSPKQADTSHITALTSQYKLLSVGGTYTNQQGFTISSDGDLWIYDERYKTSGATAFKTAMSGVQLVYELAEPFTIQLTPKELKLLKQYNHITTNGTTITLGYQPDNVVGELKGEIEKCSPNPEFMHFELNGNVVDAIPIIFDEAIHSYTVIGDNWKDKTFLCVECCDMRYGILQLVLSSDMAFVDSCGKALMLYPYMRSIEQYIKITISLGQSYGYEISYQTTNTSSLLDYLKIRVRLFN